MFAALTVVRLREAIINAGLAEKRRWVSSDDVPCTDLPLASATERVLGSMQSVLTKTKEARDEELDRMSGPLGALDKEKDSEKRLHLRRTKAAEVRIVRCLKYLGDPEIDYNAVAVDLGEDSTADISRS